MKHAFAAQPLLPPPVILNVQGGPGVDDEESADLTRSLRQQLINFEVGKVEATHKGSLPEGAKGDVLSLTTLAVSLAPAAITTMMGILQTWLSRHQQASITVESGGDKLTLTGTLSDEQQQMVEGFLNRNKA